MSLTQKTDTVSFTVKGQVVIPSWLRKDFDINEGTRAVVYKHNDHIVLKPLTAAAIRGARGLLKKKPGEKPFRQWWAEYKKEEKTLEEARYARTRPR
jgi:AbrB family looped-hinge helix DNA binding protein